MAEAWLGEMLFKDYMRLALAGGCTRGTAVRAWCAAADHARLELMLACAGEDGVLGAMVQDPVMRLVLMLLLEPEFAEEAEQTGLPLPAVRERAAGPRFGAILFREFVQEQVSVHSDRTRTCTAGNVVKWWRRSCGEERYMAMEEHCNSGEMCSLLFADYDKRAALLQILDAEFAAAGYDMRVH